MVDTSLKGIRTSLYIKSLFRRFYKASICYLEPIRVMAPNAMTMLNYVVGILYYI